MNRLALTVVAFSLLASPALAQQQPDKILDLSVTVPEAQQLLNALAQGPWKDTNQLMQKLVAQADAQLVPPKAPEQAKPVQAAPNYTPVPPPAEASPPPK